MSRPPVRPPPPAHQRTHAPPAEHETPERPSGGDHWPTRTRYSVTVWREYRPAGAIVAVRRRRAVARSRFGRTVDCAGPAFIVACLAGLDGRRFSPLTADFRIRSIDKKKKTTVDDKQTRERERKQKIICTQIVGID